MARPKKPLVSAEQEWPLEKIKPYPKNPRIHSPDQIKRLAADMLAYGATMPIAVDEAGVILAGHGRRAAADLNGFKTYRVVVVSGLTEAQKRAYRIADNKRGEESEWDEDLLKIEMIELQSEDDFDIGLLGFEDQEIARLLDSNEGLAPPDEEHKPPKVSCIQGGDRWILGRHVLVCGDSTFEDDVRLAVGGEKPKLMVTDPPYGVNYDPDWRNRVIRANGSRVTARAIGEVKNDDNADWTAAWMLFKGDIAYVWHGGLHTGTVEKSLKEAGFDMRAQIIWDKTRLVIGRGDYHWQHEPCWYAVRKGKPGGYVGDRRQTTVWQIAHIKSETGHSTQKPIDCMKRPIENNSKPGDAIYEPFSGSGTTIIACEITGRRAIAIEIDPVYVETAIARWEAHTGKRALLDGNPDMTLERVRQIRGAKHAKGRSGVAVPRGNASGDRKKHSVRSSGGLGRAPARRGANRKPPAADAAGNPSG